MEGVNTCNESNGLTQRLCGLNNDEKYLVLKECGLKGWYLHAGLLGLINFGSIFIFPPIMPIARCILHTKLDKMNNRHMKSPIFIMQIDINHSLRGFDCPFKI